MRSLRASSSRWLIFGRVEGLLPGLKSRLVVGGLRRLREKPGISSDCRKGIPQGAKAQIILLALSARLKSCPVTGPPKSPMERVFPKPVGRIDFMELDSRAEACTLQADPLRTKLVSGLLNSG